MTDFDDNIRDMSGCRHTFFAHIIAIAVTIILCVCFGSCASTKHVEQVNTRDSLVLHHHHDTTHVQVFDTTHVEHHVYLEDSTSLHIQFGAGGGTYNAKTGEATNVVGVQQTGVHKEQRDSIANLKHQLEIATATTDSLQQQVSNYSRQLEEERVVPKRSGYDRFCSWWFWITAIILAACIAFWICDKIPATKPYTTIIKAFFKFV